MTALAEEIDADQSTFRVDVALPEGAPTAGALFRIDDEVVRLTGTGRGGTGAGSKRTWAVARGAYGTTRASHANGTTITPYAEVVSTSPFAAPGDSALPDPAEAPDGQVPTTVDGAYALAPKVIISDTDPGAIGARNIWLREYDDEGRWGLIYQTNIRNQANDGWLQPQLMTIVDGQLRTFIKTDPGATGGDIEVRDANGVTLLLLAINPDGDIDLTQNDAAFTFVNHLKIEAAFISLDRGETHQLYIDDTGITVASYSGNVFMNTLPTADPAVAGALWADAGTVKVSAG